MTTEEFLFYVRDNSQLAAGHKGLLKEFLLACDLVKFAKICPAVREGTRLSASAKKRLDETKRGTAPDDLP